MARRGAPSPPKRLSDAQLEKAQPHQIERHMAQHEQYAERLQKIADPGKGLPSSEAERARSQHLAQITRQVDEVVRLESALPPEPSPISPSTWARVRRMNRHAVTHADRPQEEREAARAIQEAALERDRQRAAKREIAKIAERRKHPAHPQAESIVAAVAADPKLFDGLRRRLRPVSEGEGQQRAFRAYDYEDVGVLFTVLHLL